MDPRGDGGGVCHDGTGYNVGIHSGGSRRIGVGVDCDGWGAIGV